MNPRYYPIILLFFLLSLIPATAQDYQHAVKIKMFDGPAIAYKMMTGFEKGYEFTLSQLPHGGSFSGMRIYHTPAAPKKSSKWFFFYGFGAHVAIYNQTSTYNPFTPFDPPRTTHRPLVAPGFDGTAGLEYRWLKHPFALSFDVSPNFEFLSQDIFRVNIFSSFGLSYVF